MSLADYGTENSAFKMAYEAHKGQKDLAGVQYFLHVARVAGMVRGTTERKVALLHDVVEDSGVLLSEIYEEFGQEVSDAVQLLTRVKGESYENYIENLCLSGNRLAMEVKLADIKDHLDPDRPVVISQNKQEQYWAAFWRIVFELLKGRQ